MTRLNLLEPEKAGPGAARLFDLIATESGMIPNMVKAMGNSPLVLEAYLYFNERLSNGALDSRLREKIALAVAESNKSEYCLALHTALGKSVGVSEEELADSRQAMSADGRTNAVLRFVRFLLENRGNISDAEMKRLRMARFGDVEISEIVAHVALNIFANYFNAVAKTPLDFPPAPLLPEKEK